MKVLVALFAGVMTAGHTFAQESEPTPDVYGMYIIQNGNLSNIIPSEVSYRIGLAVAGNPNLGAYAVDGLATEPETIVNNPTFIAYAHGMDPHLIHFGRLGYLESLRAEQFNLGGADCFFFPNTFRRHCSDVIPVKVWFLVEDVPLRKGPVVGYDGMFRLRPAELLPPGKYALYFDGALHDHVISIDPKDKPRIAYFFEVAQ